MQRFRILILFYALISLAFAASPPSFCKCTCFTNSTIIQLGPASTPSPNDPSPASLSLRSLSLRTLLNSRAAGNGGSSCSKCNRAFCLAQGIPFCKTADEKDVFTTCFQRDSRKDQIIVLLFIAATCGLLVWAGVRRVLEKRAGRWARPAAGGEYVAVGGS